MVDKRSQMFDMLRQIIDKYDEADDPNEFDLVARPRDTEPDPYGDISSKLQVEIDAHGTGDGFEADTFLL